MPVIIVDRHGTARPANAIVFGDGFTVSDQGSGIARLDASGEVTREATIEDQVVRWEGTASNSITIDRTVDRSVTRLTTRPYDATRDRYASEVTVTRDVATVSRDGYARTVTQDASVTDAVTHDKYGATRFLSVTEPREITVTRPLIVTRWA